MKGMVVVCSLALLTSSAAYAQQQQGSGQQSQMSQSQINIMQDEARAAQNAANAQDRSELQLWVNSLPAQNKLRQKLAEAWQSLGMSPQGAKVVADAYRPEALSQGVHHVSLHGKSEQEVSAMLQSALSKKNYLLADQLLIDYERSRLSLGAQTTQNGVR